MEFKLSPHEVMRGLKVKDGHLVLRPSGLILFNTCLDFAFGVAVAVFGVVMGGLWIVLSIAGAVAMDAILRMRVAVTVGRDDVIVKNRTRNHRLPVARIAEARVEKVRWLLRQPAYLGHGASPFGWEWLIGVIRTTDGGRVQCDALISAPERKDATDVNATPAEPKIEALNRWLSACGQAS